jgi:AraC-like DNA-binding protein
MCGTDDLLPPGGIERRRHPRIVQPPLGLTPMEGGVRRLHFDTAPLPVPEQFSAWQRQMDVMFDVSLPEGVGARQQFLASQTVWDLEGMLVVEEVSPAMSFVRSPDKVRMSPVDHWCINFLGLGQSWTEVESVVAENQPAMMEVRSLGLAFRGRKTATSGINLMLPVDLFADLGGLPTFCNNVVVGGHRVRLLLDHLTSVRDNLHRVGQQELPAIRANLRNMIFEAVVPLIDREAQHDQTVHVGLMTRARRFIMEHLASPDLTVEALCQHLAVSRTRLYELFESSGGVAHYIRRRRLLAAHARLTDPADTRKVAEIAFALGFDSAANFTRAFTQQFGQSPNHLRIAGQALSAHLDPTSANGAEVTFDQMVRTLGA